MEEAQKLAIGQRIKSLRERSPYKQQAVADKLGIGLRAYQKLEEVGTTHYERCEELAAIFKSDPMWIWEGEAQGPAPDVMGALNGDDRLAELEAQVSELQGGLADALDLLAFLVTQEVSSAAGRIEDGEREPEHQRHEPERVRRLGEVLRRAERLRRLAEGG